MHLGGFAEDGDFDASKSPLNRVRQHQSSRQIDLFILLGDVPRDFFQCFIVVTIHAEEDQIRGHAREASWRTEKEKGGNRCTSREFELYAGGGKRKRF